MDAGSAAMGLLRQLDAERSSPARPAALGLGLADLVARVGVHIDDSNEIAGVCVYIYVCM